MTDLETDDELAGRLRQEGYSEADIDRVLAMLRRREAREAAVPTLVELARGVYGSRALNRRDRRTKEQLAALDQIIIHAVDLDAPVSLRGVYYRVVSLGAVDKTEASYRTIKMRLLKLRREGRIPYSDIADGTRWVVHPTRYDSPEDALEHMASIYRRSLWTHSAHRLHLFSEKDAISGVVTPICKAWDVPLGIVRGYSSETFAWNVAQGLERGRLHIIAQLGDHDPSGVNAWEDFTSKVAAMTSAANVSFIRLAVTAEQIVDLNLPTRPTKKSDSRAAQFSGESVEVDAIPAATLRQIVDDWIQQYVDQHELEVLRVAEESERAGLLRLSGRSA